MSVDVQLRAYDGPRRQLPRKNQMRAKDFWIYLSFEMFLFLRDLGRIPFIAGEGSYTQLQSVFFIYLGGGEDGSSRGNVSNVSSGRTNADGANYGQQQYQLAAIGNGTTGLTANRTTAAIYRTTSKQQPNTVSARTATVVNHHHTSLRRCNPEHCLKTKRRVLKMLIVVVLEFFICWTPLYVVNTLSFFAPKALYEGLGYTGISLVQLLAQASCCCNPITYCFMSSSFRRAFVKAFGCLRKRDAVLSRSVGTV